MSDEATQLKDKLGRAHRRINVLESLVASLHATLADVSTKQMPGEPLLPEGSLLDGNMITLSDGTKVVWDSCVCDHDGERHRFSTMPPGKSHWFGKDARLEEIAAMLVLARKHRTGS